MNHIPLGKFDDFFKPLSSRPSKGCYFCRINGCNEEVIGFIKQYDTKARQRGVVIEGRLPNPDIKNLSYYSEIMGEDFRLDKLFISSALRKWLPRVDFNRNQQISSAIYNMLSDLQRKGKNENMLKNAYIKFMCWLYYKFERMLSYLGSDEPPKILYDGDVSSYELMMLRILSTAGTDIVMVQCHGDAAYLQQDPRSEYSEELRISGMQPFPADFSLQKLRQEKAQEAAVQRIYGPEPSIKACTNAWVQGRGFDDLKTPITSRGNDSKFFYNCFFRMNGVHDKVSYTSDLYRYQLDVKNSGRKIVIVDEVIPQPTFEEINKIRKGNYARVEQLIPDMASNISFPQNIELQKLMSKVFTDLMLEISKEPGNNMSRLTNRAVYLLCWLKRYSPVLFEGWKMPEVACYIYLGGCRNENEALFIRMLARLPVDVLILIPDKNKKGAVEDSLLLDFNYDDSLQLSKYPQDSAELRVGTVAYHAERELDKIMYDDDSGIYRTQQYGRADPIVLRTMYEEIDILWKEELKYRPNFGVSNGVVTIPVIFSKICGVKDNNVENYWISVKRLFTSDSLVFDHFPIIPQGMSNPVRSVATEFFKNGRLQRDVIKQHRLYNYGVLREEAQQHILDKLQILINERFIKGTFENGTEYTIVSTILSLDTTVVRLIQKFDFTKVNPKVICLSLNENSMSLEDTIFLTFLSLVGFDVAIFVPTGYQTVERWFNSGKERFDVHQIGDYVYDLRVPNFSRVSDKFPTKKSWRDKFFKKGK